MGGLLVVSAFLAPLALTLGLVAAAFFYFRFIHVVLAILGMIAVGAFMTWREKRAGRSKKE